MARDEIIYQSVALFVGPTPATGFHFSSGNSGVNHVRQLHRVDTLNDSFDIPSEEIPQFGQLRSFSREIIDSPTPTFEFEYYLTNGINEKRMGFDISGTTSLISGILNGTQDEKNYFALFVPEGNDAVGFTDDAQHVTVGLGNGFLSNIEFSANVGEFARASVSVEGSNYDIIAGSELIEIPAVNPADGEKIDGVFATIPDATSGVAGMPKVIKYGDVTLDLSSAANLMGATLAGEGSAHIQGFTLSIPLEREALNRLGTKFAYARKINFPVTATLNLEAIVSDLNTGSLADIVNKCSVDEFNFDIHLRACVANDKQNVMKFLVRGATLDAQNFSLSVGDRRTVSIPFQISIGGPQDTKGIYISGSYTGD
jgi:hypothetical protein